VPESAIFWQFSNRCFCFLTYVWIHFHLPLSARTHLLTFPFCGHHGTPPPPHTPPLSNLDSRGKKFKLQDATHLQQSLQGPVEAVSADSDWLRSSRADLRGRGGAAIRLSCRICPPLALFWPPSCFGRGACLVAWAWQKGGLSGPVGARLTPTPRMSISFLERHTGDAPSDQPIVAGVFPQGKVGTLK